VAAEGNSFELFQGFQPAAAGVDVPSEEIANKGIHRGVLAQCSLSCPLQQDVVDAEGEIGDGPWLHGSRGARAAIT